MDNQPNSLAKIDDSSDTVRIDVRGSLTQDSRPDLLHEIRRVRRMGVTSQSVAESRPDFTALMYPEELAETLEAAAVRPLSSYSSEELLAASDSVFELLDDPSGHAGNELLAQYDAIVEELNRRELCKATAKQAAGS
ncbi:hypothetical protein SRABI83_02170 [Arthrobacter sp. Bi83]|jgi:hypothetical protein|uniref:hypothetical protein n=1 Tax=Arthrobacter sp. Bi83 TaxID=2822353 RepID=UPI001D5C6546|nr:hypothetical protein [Arthrobacter sp. Bi83]CAH0212212.1 hypothetical protein SRABI83_02170 [Arthrobacter sp. Bi83]